MSQFQLKTKNGLTVTYGVDHVTSTFINIRDPSKGEDDEEYYVVSVSNQGITARDTLTDKQRHCVNRFKDRFTFAAEKGIPYPNLDGSDVIELLTAFDVELKNEMEIYSNLD